MDSESDALERLRQVLAQEEGELLASIPKGSRRVALLEVARAMDSLTGLHHQSEDPALHSMWHDYYIHGWPRALRLFLDEETSERGDPYFLSNARSHQAALSVLRTCSAIASCEQVITLCEHGLFSLTDWSANEFTFRCTEARAGWEFEERGDQEWLRTELNAENAPFWAALHAYQAPVVDELRRNVRRVEDFMAYESTPILDDYYEAQAALYSRTCFGQDLFPDTTTFGGRPFQLFRATVRTLIGWALRHEAFAGVLLQRHRDLNVRNVFTQCAGLDELADGLSRKLEVTTEDARLALEMVTATPANKSILEFSGPSPILVAVGKDRVLKSFAGATTQPYYFMLRALKARFLDDWNAATDAREDVFREEIYSLLEPYGLRCVRRSVDVRTPKGKTDVDAVLFDEAAGTLGLFQLKWQEPFGYSLRERASRKQNFEKANQWVERMCSWLESRPLAEAGTTLGFERDVAAKIHRCHLIVLAREHSHFSGPSELDERAAWGNWFQLRRLFETDTRPDVGPIDFASTALRERTKQGPEPRVSLGSEWQLGATLVKVAGDPAPPPLR